MIEHELLLALDPVAFSKHIGIDPDPWQADVLRYSGKRLLLNCSRQSGKSTTTATKALHTGVYYPKSLILLVSPSLRQSMELFRKVKNGYESMINRPRLIEDNKTSLELENGSRIVSLPSDPATVRGFSGVDLILFDEAAHAQTEFYNAVLPMLIISNGTIICMSTPWGKTGFFYKEWSTGGDHWERVEIPAPLCPRISPDELEKQKRSIGDMFFKQEYLCQFTETLDTVFSYDLIQDALDPGVTPLFGVLE